MGLGATGRDEKTKTRPKKRNELDNSNREGRTTNGKEEEQRESYPGEEAAEQDE